MKGIVISANVVHSSGYQIQISRMIYSVFRTLPRFQHPSLELLVRKRILCIWLSMPLHMINLLRVT